MIGFDVAHPCLFDAEAPFDVWPLKMWTHLDSASFFRFLRELAEENLQSFDKMLVQTDDGHGGRRPNYTNYR